ncbi:MAG: cupin domain-containing protein [Actinomycetota bacterium]
MSKRGRVFVRGIESEKYGLSEVRRSQLTAPRVRGGDVVVDDARIGHSGDSKDSRTWWRLGPGDDPFLTQNLQVHFVELPPGKSNNGHGHQNEACFYVLEGSGYEIHDDRRYDWSKDDLVVVHNDSVHRHFNASDTETARTLVVKAKSTYMFLGLLQQGRSAPVADESRWGERVDWSSLWSPGTEARSKIVKPADTTWETTRDGNVRVLCSGEREDVRVFSVDLYEQDIPAGSRSARHWHMADEVLYVLSGSGYSLHYEVEAEIAERYHARIAREPSRHDFTAGDLVYVPQNTVHQHFNASSDEPLRLLSAQNRVIKLLGYDNVVYLEDAPEYEREAAVAGADR